MYKLLLTTTLTLLPTLALAQPDPCKSLNGMLDQVEAAYKESVSLDKILNVVPKHYHVVTEGVYSMMSKGDIRYTAYRQGISDGCDGTFKGVMKHVKN